MNHDQARSRNLLVSQDANFKCPSVRLISQEVRGAAFTNITLTSKINKLQMLLRLLLDPIWMVNIHILTVTSHADIDTNQL